MASDSLCALGQLTPGPIMSALRYFREEFDAHINEKRCPALQCKPLTAYYILPDKCRACGRCRRSCPTQVISGDRKMIHVINQDGCIKCGTCMDVCPFDAVVKVSGETVRVPSEPVPLGSFS